jgi:hypothetical protein
MKFILTSLFVIVSVITFAQTAYFKVNGTGRLDKIERVSTGGYVTSGYDSNYKHQYVRWDENFNPIWKIKLDDTGFAPFSNLIIEANDGSFYASAMSYFNSGSFFVMKISSTGTILWQKNYAVPGTGNNLFSPCLSKAAGTDNGFLFGTGNCALSNCVVKCDANGAIEWQKQYLYPLASGVITCWSILPDGNNYIISSGYNVKSLLTFKLDLLGNVVSHTANTYTWTPQIIPTKLVKLNAGGGYGLLGQYNNSNNNKTQFVAFYSSALALQSFNELTVTYNQFTLTDITAINNGQDVVVNGNMYDSSKFYSAVLKLSATGSIGWKHLSRGNTTTTNKNVEFEGVTSKGNSTIHVGAGFNEGAIGCIMDSNGNGLCNTLPFNVTNVPRTLTLESSSMITVPGNAFATTSAYNTTTNVSYNKSIYCGSLVSNLDESNAIESVSVYPNPSDNSIRIRIEQQLSEPANVSIYGMDGRQLMSDVYYPNMQIATEHFPSGTYLLVIKTAHRMMTEKLTVRH